MTEIQIEQSETAQEAAFAAMEAIGFDGENPRRVSEFLLAVADCLAASGFTYRDVGILMSRVAARLYDFSDSVGEYNGNDAD